MGGGRARPARWMRTHRLENALEPLLRQVVEEQGHARLDILHERPRLLGQAKETIPHALVVGVSAASENRGRWGGAVSVRRVLGSIRSLSSGRKVRMGSFRLGHPSATLRSEEEGPRIARAAGSRQPPTEGKCPRVFFCWPAGSPCPGNARSPADEDDTAEFVVAAGGHTRVSARCAPVELIEDLGRRHVPHTRDTRQHGSTSGGFPRCRTQARSL